MPVLDLWMNGLFVGKWHKPARGPSQLSYAPDWIAHPQGRPLSLSLPFTFNNEAFRGEVVDNYFDNLLPDNPEIRQRIASRFKTRSLETFALLEAIGRDAAGAVQLLPENSPAPEIHTLTARPLTESDVAEHLRGTLTARQDLAPEDFRFSLAGAQEKTALLWHQGQWHIPQGSTPSSHIFKLPLGLAGNVRFDLSHSVENEWLCMELLKELGLNVAHTQIGQFEDQKVLIVERFDRVWSRHGHLIRLPHEDLLQASGLPSHAKYESHGGPGIHTIMQVLSGSSNALADRQAFFKTLLVFYLLAAPDGHAKNFSLAIEPGGYFRLAPLYDVLSAWPWVGTKQNQCPIQRVKMAMALRTSNTRYKMQEVLLRHWLAVGKTYIGQQATESLIGDLHQLVEPAIQNVSARLPAHFPEHIKDAIFHGLRSNLQRLK